MLRLSELSAFGRFSVSETSAPSACSTTSGAASLLNAAIVERSGRRSSRASPSMCSRREFLEIRETAFSRGAVTQEVSRDLPLSLVRTRSPFERMASFSGPRRRSSTGACPRSGRADRALGGRGVGAVRPPRRAGGRRRHRPRRDAEPVRAALQPVRLQRRDDARDRGRDFAVVAGDTPRARAAILTRNQTKLHHSRRARASRPRAA